MWNVIKSRRKVFCFKSNALVEYFWKRKKEKLEQLVKMEYGKTFVG